MLKPQTTPYQGATCYLQLIRTTGCDSDKRPAGSRSLWALDSTGQQVAVSASCMRSPAVREQAGQGRAECCLQAVPLRALSCCPQQPSAAQSSGTQTSGALESIASQHIAQLQVKLNAALPYMSKWTMQLTDFAVHYCRWCAGQRLGQRWTPATPLCHRRSQRGLPDGRRRQPSSDMTTVAPAGCDCHCSTPRSESIKQ